MSNIALIPAKGFSRRIPGKNFMDFCGKPLVQWSIEQAFASKLVDDIIVSTDMVKLLKYDTLILKRPESLCQADTTQEEVIEHAIDALHLTDDDNIVLLQPTSPLRLRGDIDGAIEQMEKYKMPCCFSTIMENDCFLWFNCEPYNFTRGERQYKTFGLERETGSIYVLNVGSFLRNPSRYAGSCETFPTYKWQQFEIDTAEDIPIVEYFMKSKILKEEE